MKKIFLIISLLISVSIHAQEKFISKDSLSLIVGKEWKFSPKDNPEMSAINFDDNKWTTISSYINYHRNASNLFKGVGWFRFHFAVDSSLVNIPLAQTNRFVAGKSYIGHIKISDANIL